MMKNIFQIVSDKTWSGIDQYVYDLSSALKDKGNYVEIVCKKYDPVISQFRHLELPISILPLKGFTDFDSPVRFARLIKRNNNIVHVHSLKDAATAILARHISENKKTKIVLTRHLVKKAEKSMAHRLIYREIDKIVFVSDLARQEFMKSHPRVKESQLTVIHNSVTRKDDKPLNALNLREKYHIQPHVKILMYHGRICPEKGIETLLKAASQLDRNSFFLFIIGDGSPKYVSCMKAFVIANQLLNNVAFIGFQENVQHLVEQSDIGVLPSIWKEPFGLPNIEYMMQGKPHITTGNGAQKEYVANGETGILTAPGDFHELAAAIKTLVENDSLCTRIGTAAQEYFEAELSYDHFYSRIDSIYDELLK